MMRTITFIVVCLFAGIHGYSQRITLSENNATLQSVFQKIEKQSGYLFWYTDALLQGAKKVNIKVKEVGLKEVLEIVFKGQPLSYEVLEKVVVVKRRGEERIEEVPPVKVKGVVKGNDNQPLGGATIRARGKNISTISNDRGYFEIDIESGTVLIISYVGFEEKEWKVNNNNPLNIVLNQLNNSMDTSVVMINTGYQQLKPNELTGSVVQIDNKEINRTVSTNILDRIINQTNSLKKESRTTGISIRGFSTINASTKPLIVVDGFPYEEGVVTSPGIILNNINPNDVESITILRDAAAASIWGARSGNGVIVITTKKGRYDQKLNMQLTGSINVAEKPDLFKLKLMSSADVIDYERQLFNAGLFNSYNGPFTSTYSYPLVSGAMEIMLAQKRGAITKGEADLQLARLSGFDNRNDISKYLLQMSVNQQYNFNVSGGSEKLNFYGSIGFDRNLASSVGQELNRVTLKFDNSFKPIKNLEINSYIAYTQGSTQNSTINYSSFLANGSSMMPPYNILADEQGNPLHVPVSGMLRTAYIDTLLLKGLLDWHYRPLEEMQNVDDNIRQFNIRLGGGIKYNIMPTLNLQFSGQYERFITNTNVYYNSRAFTIRNFINRFMYLNTAGQPQYPVPLGGMLDFTNSLQTAYNLRAQANLNKRWNIHSIVAIVGSDIRDVRITSNKNRKYGYDPLTLVYTTNMDYNTRFTTRPSGTGLITDASSLTGLLNRFLSSYSNIAYTLMNKYTFTASGRIDASNFFGIKANLRAVPLWSIGAKWLISQEDFFKSGKISLLSCKITYGFNGNMDNSATALPTIVHSPGFTPYNNAQPYAERRTPPNPGLTWEKTAMINAGVEVNAFNNRLNGSVEFYAKKSDNLIAPSFIIDPTSGVNQYTGNIAGLRGKGIDIGISSMILKRKITWTSLLSFSYNIDKITSYYLPASSVANGNSYAGGTIVVGKPRYNLYSYRWAGLNNTNGDPMGYVNGEVAPYSKVIGFTGSTPNSRPEDMVYHGTVSPLFFGNYINTIAYKGFSASFNITYFFDYFFLRPSVNYNNLRFNLSAHSDYALRWKKPGDELTTNVPSVPSAFTDSRYNFYGKSEILVEKGDHIRLQDIKLSYDFNNRCIRILRGGSLFMNANNIGILWRANKKGIDPDSNNNLTPPQPRSIAFGLTVNF